MYKARRLIVLGTYILQWVKSNCALHSYICWGGCLWIGYCLIVSLGYYSFDYILPDSDIFYRSEVPKILRLSINSITVRLIYTLYLRRCTLISKFKVCHHSKKFNWGHTCVDVWCPLVLSPNQILHAVCCPVGKHWQNWDHTVEYGS